MSINLYTTKCHERNYRSSAMGVQLEIIPLVGDNKGSLCGLELEDSV